MIQSCALRGIWSSSTFDLLPAVDQPRVRVILLSHVSNAQQPIQKIYCYSVPVRLSVLRPCVKTTESFHAITVKPLIVMCPLFREFRELNKTAKLTSANINKTPTLIIGIACCLKIVCFEFAKIKGAKINLHDVSRQLLRQPNQRVLQ